LLLVNQLGGSTAVVLLNICRQTSRFFLQFTSALSASLHPELTLSFARNERQRILTLYAGTLALVTGFGTVFSTALALLGPSIILLWTGELKVLAATIGVIALESATAGIANVSLLPLWSANQLGRLPGLYVLSQAAGLVGSALVFGQLGVAGVGLMFIGVNILFTMVAWHTVLKIYACRPREFMSLAVLGLLCVARSSSALRSSRSSANV